MQKFDLVWDWKSFSIKTSYFLLTGKKPGPKIFLTGGMHGDEINGVEVVSEFLQWAEKSKLEEKMSGSMIIFPVLNTPGFADGMRFVPLDFKDLNRQFADKAIETVSEYMAQQYTYLLKDCALGIDCHDSGSDSVLLPHVRVHRDEEGKPSCSFSLAQAFGTRYILLRDGDPGMMAVAFRKKFGMPVVTVETGGAKKLFPNFVKVGVQGIKNILIAQKMIKGKIKVPKTQILIHNRVGMIAAEPAIVEFHARLGSTIKKGEHVGRIFYPNSQKREELHSPISGQLISRRYANHVPAGGVIFSVLADEKENKELQTEKLPEFEFKPMSV